MLRFDGLYLSNQRDCEGNTTCRTYLRFYPDGSVIEQVVQQPATVTQVMKWITPAQVGIPVGEYTLEADHIKFYTILEYGSDHPCEPVYPSVREDYKGRVYTDRLILFSTKPSGRIAENCEYEFLAE